MENVSDALKMAFAIFVFIIALSMVFFLLTEVKTTADSILFDADKTNYFEWETGSLENGRIVGIDTVISTLKNYTTQSTYVIVEDERGSTEYNFNTSKEEIESFINSNIRSTAQYLENIREITTGGKYMVAEDGTRVTIQPGTTRTYVIYTKI